MNPRTMTRACLYLITGLACQLFGPGAQAHGQSVVKYNSGDKFQCVSLGMGQHFGQESQYYFSSTCPLKAHFEYCFQVSDKSDKSPFNCSIHLGGSDIVAGQEVPTVVPVTPSYIPHVFVCYDPLYPREAKFNGHGIDATCRK